MKTTQLLGHDNLPLQIIQCSAGWYVGTIHDRTGHHSRDSAFFPTREGAESQYQELLDFANDFNPLPY